MSVVDQALVDMRNGGRVLVVAPTQSAAVALFDNASRRLTDGETGHRSHSPRIRGAGEGWIQFQSFSAAGRGLTLDRVYVELSALVTELAPAVGGDLANIRINPLHTAEV
ncbi:hypothetical protein B7C42_01633 [Nocardia cerradoensis]|uniref:Uncharacterized protein n=1 Tax=Nocardia cerradoensis TaxID=85688 RepID=A0A231HD14_9NOCA|nr:hypothetical protein [Nocardia cerradoensis]OXR46658.1 hypothetical protein B7C42_01633 [Nocardia cerradoensis]